ncbi:MAG: hypothetical protein SLAVMIC_00380 [uncultured marine phage]|uniref:Uncharacterized protein n=1 Tax=uncultured marine phage TaxID=707152 RepID=A0A8D9C8T9_9VIRU|nr:MAG: hypothetical protein SLAVMIC_00380 [uncultured marine phage]
MNKGDKVKLIKKMKVYTKAEPDKEIKLKRGLKGVVSSTFTKGIEVDLEDGQILRVMNENIEKYIKVLS